MSENRSPAEIEREIEEERSALAHSLEELQAQFSPEHIVETASNYLKDHGGDIAQTIGRQIKENPAAAALTSVGLAWLIFGSSRPASTYDRYAATHDTSYADDEPSDDEAPQRTAAVAYDRNESATVPGLRRTGRPAMAGFDERLANVNERHEDPSVWDRTKGTAADLSERAGDMAHAAKLRSLETINTARHRVEDAADAIGDNNDHPNYTSSAVAGENYARSARPSEWAHRENHLYQTRNDGTRSTGRRLTMKAENQPYGSSKSLLARISEGTEHMSKSARLRVMRARQRAYEAQQEMEDRFGHYSDRAGRVFDRQPLLGGLLMAGIGALVGAAIPRTEKEDRAFGAYRDRAFDEAERIYHEERVKLRAVADAAMEEAKSMAKETLEEVKTSTPTGDDAVNRAENAVRTASDRVAKAAKSEAEKQDLGSSLN